MFRTSRSLMSDFVIAWLVVGSYASAQMPMTRGKVANPEGFDEGIIRDRDVQKFAAPRVPPPPPAPQVKIFVGGVKGQRFLTLEQPAAAPAEDDDPDGPPEERPPQPPAMPFHLQGAVLGRDNFDRWVFGDGFVEASLGEPSRRDRLNSQIGKKIEAISRKHLLTTAQESKLWLAGHGDVKRFFDRVEDGRRRFEAARTQFNSGMACLNSLDPLSQEFEEGPFGDGSLFAKTLRKIENDSVASRR